MSISGNLKTMELAELLQWLSQAQKSGTLVFNNGRVEKSVVFESGRITSTASTDPNEYLGHFLVGHGFISELELSQAMEMQDSNNMLLGKILVTLGAVDEASLDRILRLKAEESLYDIFNWSEGEFRFHDDQLPESTMVPMALDVTAVVMEGSQRVDEWRRIREVIPNDQAIPVSIVELLEGAELSEGARNILSRVDDDRTIAEICLETHSSEYHVCRTLFHQLLQGRIKVVRPRWRKPDTVQIRLDPETTDSAAPPDSRAMIKEAQQHYRKRDFTRALRFLAAARSLEPESHQVRQVVEKAEGLIQNELEKMGIVGSAVPKLEAAPDELTGLDLTPQEGFIVSRIDGRYDLHSIIKISPMRPLDALVVFWRLQQAGHITLHTP